jgi:hypothetical protein
MSSKASRRAKRDFPHGVLSKPSTCPHCGGEGPHFIPPSFGDIGFFSCDVPADIRNHTRCRPPYDHENDEHVPAGVPGALVSRVRPPL